MSQLPSNWAVSTIGEIAEIIRGVTFKKGDAVNTPGSGLVPILRATNIDGSLLLDEELTYVDHHFVREDQRLQIGDVVVATSSGSVSVVGKSAQLKRSWEGAFGAFCAVIRPHPFMDARFLAHYVSSRHVRDLWRDKAQGTNINNLKISDIATTALPFPSVGEQRRIVATIEEQFNRLDTGSEAVERAESNSARLKSSAFQAAVASGSPPVPLDSLTVQPNGIIDGPFGSNLKTAHYSKAGPRVIRLQNIGDTEFVDARAHISLEHYQRLVRHSVRAGDLVCAILGDVLPRAVIVPPGVEPAIVKADCPRIRLAAEVNPIYVWAVLNAPSTRRAVSTKIKGIGRPRLTLRNLREIPIPLPPRNEQDHRAAVLSEQLSDIQRLTERLEIVHGRLNILRSSILRSAFTGQLVDQTSADEPGLSLLEKIAVDRTNGHQPSETK